MRVVRPKHLGAEASKLPLTPEEGFVLSRIDGQVSETDLVAITGLAPERVEEIVTKLFTHGAVDVDAAPPPPRAPSAARMPAAPPMPAAHAFGPGTTSLEDFAAALGIGAEDKNAPAPPPAPAAAPKPRETASLADFAAALGMDPSSVAEDTNTANEAPTVEVEAVDESRASAALESADELEEVKDDDPEAAPPPEEGEANPDEIARDDMTAQERERNYRQIYETKWHTLPTDQRVAGAQTARGSDLFALCLDSEPRVVSAVLENPQVTLDHVRMIAAHHRTTTGIEILSRRSDWLRDMLVERRLLRNPQVGEIVLGKIVHPKALGPTYRIAIDREVPELTRVKVRGHLRKKWQTSAPEDRAELVVRTEARCLVLMTGCTFDARATQILCGRNYNSVLFIQNLAKFTATPPALLAHLIKQPFVRKIAPLKKLLLQHPNMPGEVKRQI